MSPDRWEDVWRSETPHILAALLRRSGDFEACEDAVQEALLAAAGQWPTQGVPDNPRGWLIRVASRKLMDQQRSHTARTQREVDAAIRAAQVAAGFLVPEATMAQRISRAKATLRTAGATFEPPTWGDLPGRLHVVRHVVYLAFNEGYTTSSGACLIDTDLAGEAIRLAERLHRSIPEDTETSGLLALMLLTHARTPARTDHRGDLMPLDQQDRTRWDRDMILRGTALIEQALPGGPVGPFQLQAAIAAVHDEAATAEATDWMQITMLYRMLDSLAPSPTVTLNLAVAVGMAHGPAAGIAALAPLLERAEQRRSHRVHAAHAHLLELAGNTAAAKDAYRLAARLTDSIPEQRYLNGKALES